MEMGIEANPPARRPWRVPRTCHAVLGPSLTVLLTLASLTGVWAVRAQAPANPVGADAARLRALLPSERALLMPHLDDGPVMLTEFSNEQTELPAVTLMARVHAPAAVVAEITRALHAGRAGGTVWFAVLSGWAGIARCRSLAARITSSARSRRCRAPASSVRIATSHRRRQQLPHPSSDPVPVMPTLPETVVRGRRPPGEPAADPAPATASVNTARLKACPKSV